MLTALFAFHISSLPTMAQTEPEYRMELGAGIGMVSYQGDFNASPLENQQPMFTLLAKYRFDPRRALSFNVSYGWLKGSAKDAKTYYPAEAVTGSPDAAVPLNYDFKHQVVDAGLRLEYNFWPYGTGFEYRGAKRLTPYVTIGLGMTVVKAQSTVAALNVPAGVGVKYKVADRLNLAAEWAMHITGSDRLDGIADPYGIKSSGLFKNTDCYSHLRLTLTYDFWTKCRTCHNDRD